ncbi:hypothetical protein N657DRAFT_652012 [Parathielavia appendiculata]|uniref:Centromere protein H C-terminal domain-containing protein n=1 Tax=Parathielavia appendiculata TaxID=2587402 RepID=A0AAN6U9C3_9PEZI|nr:hypothetical protein N657DRAFT_652012 [Parathielavia appendiculata]
MVSHTVTAPGPLALTEAEANVLALYDQLQQLQLEFALLRSQRDHHASAGSSQLAGDDLVGGQSRLLEAKATLALHSSVVESAVSLQPTLNAVHHATHASVVERDLLPTIEQRDVVAIKAAKSCSELQTARGRLAELGVECLRASQQNIKLASETLLLAGRARGQNQQDVGGGRLGRDIATLEGQVKSSHHRWRVVKGAASAIVAGSGIDWVREERLRNMVLDPPD